MNFPSRISLFFFVLSAALLMTGAAPVVQLSPYVEKVAKTIQFDRRVLVIMKQESGGGIQRLTGYDENQFQIIVDGVFVPVPSERTYVVLAAIRKKVAPLKYQAFVVDMNENIKSDKIGVLKGTDQYDILRIMQTTGHKLSNEDIIERLKKWEENFPFNIIGAHYDWVEIEFKKTPKDLAKFAQEVYDFCPQAVEQGFGSIAELVLEIQRTNRLFLVWD